MGPQIAKKLAPAFLAIIAIVSLLAAERTEGIVEAVFYLMTAVSLGGLISAARFDQ